MLKKPNITKKSVLLECLSIMRSELAICSKHYNGLEPKEGMEEAWEQGRIKVEILKDLCQSMDSPLVEEALATWRMSEEKAEETNGKLKDWQTRILERGPEALPLDEENEDRNPINGPLPDIRKLWGWNDESKNEKIQKDDQRDDEERGGRRKKRNTKGA